MDYTIVFGPSDPPLIHHAGGHTWLQTDRHGNLRLHEKHRFSNTPLKEISHAQMNDPNFVCQNFEYHCVLMNTKIIKEIGGCDERLIRREHIDTSLRMLSEGHTISLASDSLVMYEVFNSFIVEDWPYFLFRWNADKSEETANAFLENWDIFDSKRSARGGFLKRHKERAMSTLLSKLKGVPQRPLMRKLLLKCFVRPYVSRFDKKVNEDTNLNMLPKRGNDALHNTGIEFIPYK